MYFRNRDEEIHRKRTEKSFFVPKQEIVEQGYDLSINKYKKIEYEPIQYPPSQEILEEITRLNEEIAKELQELKEMGL